MICKEHCHNYPAVVDSLPCQDCENERTHIKPQRNKGKSAFPDKEASMGLGNNKELELLASVPEQSEEVAETAE